MYFVFGKTVSQLICSGCKQRGEASCGRGGGGEGKWACWGAQSKYTNTYAEVHNIQIKMLRYTITIYKYKIYKYEYTNTNPEVHNKNKLLRYTTKTSFWRTQSKHEYTNTSIQIKVYNHIFVSSQSWNVFPDRWSLSKCQARRRTWRLPSKSGEKSATAFTWRVKKCENKNTNTNTNTHTNTNTKREESELM